jgi:hypothetical protein
MDRFVASLRNDGAGRYGSNIDGLKNGNPENLVARSNLSPAAAGGRRGRRGIAAPGSARPGCRRLP